MAKKIIKPEVLESNKVYDNEYITVTEDKILFKMRDDDGELKTIEKSWITVGAKDFIIAIPIKNNKVLLINQYRYPIKSFNTEFVAGLIEEGDEPETCAKKELLEEAGIKTDKVHLVGKIYPQAGKDASCGYVFFCDAFEEVPSEREEFEIFANLTSSWVPISKFRDMIFEGKVKDGVTLSAWALLVESTKK